MSSLLLLLWRNSLTCELNMLCSNYLHPKFPSALWLRGNLSSSLTWFKNHVQQTAVSQQQTLLTVAGKHLETSQLTKLTGTFLRASTLLVIHSVAATRVISPPATIPLLPAFWFCETFLLCWRTGSYCLWMLKVVRNGKWTSSRRPDRWACFFPSHTWVSCIKIILCWISSGRQTKQCLNSLFMSQFTPLYGNVFLNIWLILTMLEQLGRGQCSTQRPTSCLSQQHYFQYLTCISFCMGGNPRKYCENMSISHTRVVLRQGDSVPWNLTMGKLHEWHAESDACLSLVMWFQRISKHFPSSLLYANQLYSLVPSSLCGINNTELIRPSMSMFKNVLAMQGFKACLHMLFSVVVESRQTALPKETGTTDHITSSRQIESRPCLCSAPLCLFSFLESRTLYLRFVNCTFTLRRSIHCLNQSSELFIPCTCQLLAVVVCVSGEVVHFCYKTLQGTLHSCLELPCRSEWIVFQVYSWLYWEIFDC